MKESLLCASLIALLAVSAAASPPPHAPAPEAAASRQPAAALHYVVARLAASEGDHREALAEYAKAVELAPDEPYLRLEYARLLGRLGYFSRTAQERRQRFELAAAQAEVARRLSSGDLEMLREVGLLYLDFADALPTALQAATEALEEVRSQRPDDPEVLVPLGQIYRNRGDHAAAADAFRRAVSSIPGNRWAVSLLARTLVELVQARLQAGEPAQAEETLDELLVLDPENREARMTLVELLGRRGEHSAAAEVLRGLGDDGGEDMRPRLVWELYQAGSTAEATGELVALIEEDPENSAVAGAVARELVRADRQPEADALLAELMERFEAAGEAPAAGLRLERAELEAAGERWQQVADLLAPLLSWPAGEPLPGARGWRLLYSEALVQLGRAEEALVLLPAAGSDAGAAEPGGGDIAGALLAKRAEILFHLSREEEGRQLLAQLSADGSAESLRQAVRVYQRLERFPDAVPLLERWLSAEPESVEGLFFLGAAYERTERRDDAEKTFRALLGLQPDFAPALNYLGYMLAERGKNLEEALSLVNRAVDLDPDNGAYMDSLGWAHFQLGQYAEARTYLERARDLLPDDPVIFEHLGDLYVAVGRPDLAQQVYRRSIELADGQAEAVRRKLEDLGGGGPEG